MALIINNSERNIHPSIGNILSAIMRIAAACDGSFVILEDDSDRNPAFVQARSQENGEGLLVEYQLSSPRRQFRLRHYATAAETLQHFIAFRNGRLSGQPSADWRNITDDIFGPNTREIDVPTVL